MKAVIAWEDGTPEIPLKTASGIYSSHTFSMPTQSLKMFKNFGVAVLSSAFTVAG
jgi:hypothetical protein